MDGSGTTSKYKFLLKSCEQYHGVVFFIQYFICKTGFLSWSFSKSMEQITVRSIFFELSSIRFTVKMIKHIGSCRKKVKKNHLSQFWIIFCL